MPTTLPRGYGDGTYGQWTWGYYDQPAAAPDLIFEIWTPSGWIDATCDIRSVDVHRGRTSWADAFAAGTATVELANVSGYYSAWSTKGVWTQSSAYRVDVPIRLRTRLNGQIRGLFVGTTDGVEDTWPGAGVDALSTVTATDGFKYLARRAGLPRTAVGAGELSGARINRIADDAAYTGTRKVDTGTVALQATTLEGIALDLMRLTGESEWGWLYVDRDGALVFRQRDVVQTDPRMVNVQWTFTDDDEGAPSGSVCYTDLALPVDDEQVYNVAQVTPPGIATQTAQDNASVAWFGPRTWTRTDLPINTIADALGLAQLVVTGQANSTRNVRAVSFRASQDSNTFACACGVRINDRVRVIRHYPDGYVLDAELLVEGIHHAIVADGTGKPNEWDVELSTTTALMVRDYGQWDRAVWDTDLWGV